MQTGKTRTFAGWQPRIAILALVGCLTSFAFGQAPQPDKLSADEQKQVETADRFVAVLEKNPRRGTALDRVYGHHVEFGSLDRFMQSLRERVAKSPSDGAGWMLLGLFEAHRGEDANAIDALKKAEELRPDDALASYYLGQSLLLLGRSEEAVAALERAIERNPRRTDLLEIFQQLGRVHQRAQRTDKALEVWRRLEALFPDDARVLEQIAVTLVEEGEYALALPRYQQLTKIVRDDYRRTMFRIEVAELKIRENRRDEGVAEFESLLGDLNPDSWLHRDVRRRIEDVFLRSGNQDGLVAYYEKWIASHPEDVDGMARLAKFLASSARLPEATQWMGKALKLAPTRTDLRKSFIDQLVDDQRYAEASKEYELLVASAPGNTDFLREWGKLVLKNKDLDQAARHAEATRIWNRILATRPDDPLTMSQVADLFRQSNMTDQALALYQKAVAKGNNEPQYREYLGEFYHILKRPNEALATWAAIAEGDRHNAVNVARLAEIYNSFGYLNAAVTQIAEACRLDPKDFTLQLKAAEYHSRAQKFDEALAFVSGAEKLAANHEERDAIVTQRIDIYRSSQRLEAEIESLAGKVKGNANASADEWLLLARFYEADSRWADAIEAVDNALKKDARSIPVLTAAARISELSGNYARAADTNRELAAIDRRSRGDYLMNVARLETQLGRTDAALQAGKDLIVSAPGNTDNYEFYARLCFQLGKSEEGVDTLRKAVRINPTEPHLIMALGAALSNEFRSDEAIEVYWRAFEKTEELEDKTSLTTKLTELYLQINQFDKLLERLERDRREDDKRHAMTICLAQAHHSAGDYGTARQELESLLSENTRDTNLLQQLSKLCEQGSDLDSAIEYQRQLSMIAPGHETEYRLATLLQLRGDRDAASEILVKLMRREEDAARRLKNLDSLLAQGAYESVLAIVEPQLSEQHNDWELLYRAAVAWGLLEKKEEASNRVERLLALPIAHDTLGVFAEDKFKQAQAQARSNNLRGIQSNMPTRRSALMLLSSASTVRMAVGLDPDRGYFVNSPRARSIWMPDAFGEARMAAYGWLIRFDQEQDASVDAKTGSVSPLQKRLAELGAAAAKADARREIIYDWLYIEQLRGNVDSVFQMARRLARDGGREAQQFYLNSLALRGVNATNAQMARSADQKAKKVPLSQEDLELMMQCQEALSASAAKDADSTMAAGQIAYSSNGQAYVQIGGNWVPVSGLFRGGVYVGTIVEELKLAGRTEQAEQILQKQIDSAKSSADLAGVVSLYLQEEKYDRIKELFPKWLEAAHKDLASAPSIPSTRARAGVTAQSVDPLSNVTNTLVAWMGHLGKEEDNSQVLSILDASLDLSAAVMKRRLAEQNRRSRNRSQGTQQYYRQNYALKYGKENINVQIDYPMPNQYVDTWTLMLLREAYEVLKRNEAIEDLPARLEKRVSAAVEEERLHPTLVLAYARWWLEEKEDALALLKTAGTYVNQDPSFRLEVASLHQSMGDSEDALEIVEAILPRDQKLLQQRELLALDLAERLGDTDRAFQAAERLFGLRLDSNTQIALIERMRRLGMHEMAQAITSRVERQSGNSLPALASLMALYQSQGKTDLAVQIAHTILRRTTPPLSNMSASSRNPFRYTSNSDGTMRSQSLRLLQQTGALKDLIARLNGQIEKSPNSSRLYEQLIECYEATNEREKVGTLLAKAVANTPDAIGLRYQLAKHLDATGKQAEACDQYLEILKQKPQWVLEDLYQIRRPFERANRTVDLMRALEKVNFKLVGQPYYVIDLVSNLMRERSGQANMSDNLEIALNLFEKAFNAFPQYRNQMIGRMYDPALWKNARVFELGKKSVLPTDAEVQASPWFGLDQIYSYSSGGQVNAQFHQMLQGIAGTDRVGELTQAIQKRLQEAPGWYGGEVMLALIDLKSNRKDEAKKRLATLLANEDRLKDMPSNSCWIIGQELDQFEDTRPMALKLFETAVTAPETMSQIQYSPAARLVKLYSDIGRKEDARELLLKKATARSELNYDPQYGSYLRIENSVWAAQQLTKLNCPIDAIRLFREMTNDPAAVEQAGQWYGSRPDYFKTQIDQGLKQALASLDSTNAKEAMTKLLVVSEKSFGDASALDLMLLVPEVTQLREKSMQSSLIELLITIAKDDVIAQGIHQRLDQLRQEHPEDLSIGVTRVAYLGHKQDKELSSAVTALLNAVNKRPLESIRAGRRPNSAQRRASLAHIPLWLVAKECLKSKDLRESGVALAERALEAARRQTSDQFTAAILYDWGKIALETGDREQAESKWSELLDIVTRRPDLKSPTRQPPTSSLDPNRRRSNGAILPVNFQGNAQPKAGPALKAGSAPKAGPAPRRIPPLTISQFRLTIEIAQAAAENGMPALSRKAVKASVLGGIPVPDAPTATADPFGGAVISRSPQRATSPGLDAEVAEAIRKVILKWQGDAYPAPEVYELLAALVFPETRANAILLYADSSKLQDAQVSSIGELLVDWASTAGKLDDLQKRISARTQDPAAKIPAHVLQTRIALARNRIDDANAELTQLVQLVERGATPEMVQLACHAALPASEREPLAKPAFAILKAAVNLQVQRTNENPNTRELAIGKLVSKVNRYLANDPGEVKKFFDTYLVGRQQYYSRYGGTYGQYIQWSDWAAIAEEAAKCGASSIALDYMGRVCDFSYENYSRPSTTTALAVICREMSVLDPKQRYEAWRNWTLPSEGRQAIRLVAECVEPVRIPKPFLQTAAVRGSSHTSDLLSNFTELVTAAKAADRLQELRDLVKEFYDKRLDNSAFLYALVLIELGDVETGKKVIQPLANTLGDRIKRKPRESGQPTPDGWADYLVYQACMRSPQFVELYANRKGDLRQALQSIGNYLVVARVDIDYAQRAGMTEKPTIRPGDDPLLAHWFPAATKQKMSGGTAPWWAVQEGHLAHLPSSEFDLLYFAYPLTGDFEFTVDAYKGPWAETEAGYGGIIVESQMSGDRSSIWSVSGHETVSQKQPLQRANRSFGTIRIKVANGRMQYSLNHHVIYEEVLSGTSPWITLYSGHTRASTFRNPRFTGNPQIPREVPLVHGDRMDGWNTSFYDERQPRRRLMAVKPTGENDSLAYSQRDEPTEFAWQAKDSVLIGSALSGKQQADGWAYYHRPLRDRESFNYEFFYSPGSTAAHPTLGRLALLLEPDGVREHWITRTGWDQEVLGIGSDNRITNEAAQRGPKPLPLKAGDWNQVQLTLMDDAIQIHLNGQTIYDRPVEPEIDRRFGLLRRQGQSLKVREPKLTGAWPETLSDEIRNNLLASTRQYTAADRLLINRILSEQIFEHDVGTVISGLSGLPRERAYEKLAQWVLPSPDHSAARLYFQFEPVSVGHSDGTNRERLICPAVELVKLGAELGKLPELVTTIGNLKTDGDVSDRTKMALGALVAIESGNVEHARIAMTQLYQYVTKGLDKGLAARDRAPELVVAWQAALHPELQFAALDLAEELLAKQRDENFKSADANWTTSVHMLLGHVEERMLKPSFEAVAESPLKQWAHVPYYKPNIRMDGHTASKWLYRPGLVQHVTGGTWSQLFFQSPLRGNFEILAERSHHGHREVAIAYGMHAAEPRYDYKGKRIITVMHGIKDSDGEISIPRQGGFLADYRIQVEQNKITTFVNDVKVHEEVMASQPDPWVVLQAHTAGSQSSVRNLRIRGNPVIPDEIDLIDIAGWHSWRADMYGEWFSLNESDESAPWRKSGEEIQGQLRQNLGARNSESLLMYQRPMLEDGVIEFESFFVPGELEVHPAVGRTAVIVLLGGVQRHTLTNAQYELEDTSARNDSPIAGAAAQVALKEREWNRYRIALKGDQLTVAVNGTEVATVKIPEPSNERFFGLFRYGDKTKCRVRKLVYRGEWPKTLPPVEQQQLARLEQIHQPADPSLLSVFDFSEPIAKLRASGLEYDGPAERLTLTDRGTRLVLDKSTGYGSWPKLFLKRPIAGDCTITLDFQGLKVSPPKEGWGCNFVLRATVQGNPDLSVDTGMSQNKPEVRNLFSQRRTISLAGKEKHQGRYMPTAADSGRLRLIRHGAVISTYYAPPGSDDFQLEETWPVGNAPLKSISVLPAASDAAATVEVVLNKLTIMEESRVESRETRARQE